MEFWLNENRWQTVENVHARGHVCYNGIFYDSKGIAELFSSCKDFSSVVLIAKQLNGSFSVVVNHHDFNALVVDETRLYPVFYTIKNKELHVSDEPLKLVSDDTKIDLNYQNQYLQQGHVMPGFTLAENVFQVEPASIVSYNKGVVSKQLIWSYLIPESEIIRTTFEEAQNQFLKVLDNVFRRLIASVGSRQIVLPLSAGYDSRLIACQLYKLGYKNVICYTVGRNKNGEQSIAKQVAQRLGFDFYHIDFEDPKYVMQKYDSEEFGDYVDYLGALGSFTYLFEYNAAKWLKSNGVINDDAVFVPGHSGDGISGSLIMKLGIRKNATPLFSTVSILMNLIEYGRPLLNWSFACDVYSSLKGRFAKNSVPHSVIQSYTFDTRVVLSTTNSVRAYGFFGFETRLPFFDKEMMDFFRTLPYEFLYQKKLYDDTLFDFVFKPLGVDFGDKKLCVTHYKQWVKNFAKQMMPRVLRIKIRNNSEPLGENFLTKEMLHYLVENGVIKNDNDYLSTNEIMMLWYLQRVKKQLGEL